jgi:hypothetical protein
LRKSALRCGACRLSARCPRWHEGPRSFYVRRFGSQGVALFLTLGRYDGFPDVGPDHRSHVELDLLEEEVVKRLADVRVVRDEFVVVEPVEQRICPVAWGGPGLL